MDRLTLVLLHPITENPQTFSADLKRYLKVGVYIPFLVFLAGCFGLLGGGGKYEVNQVVELHKSEPQTSHEEKLVRVILKLKQGDIEGAKELFEELKSDLRELKRNKEKEKERESETEEIETKEKEGEKKEEVEEEVKIRGEKVRESKEVAEKGDKGGKKEETEKGDTKAGKKEREKERRDESVEDMNHLTFDEEELRGFFPVLSTIFDVPLKRIFELIEEEISRYRRGEKIVFLSQLGYKPREGEVIPVILVSGESSWEGLPRKSYTVFSRAEKVLDKFLFFPDTLAYLSFDIQEKSAFFISFLPYRRVKFPLHDRFSVIFSPPLSKQKNTEKETKGKEDKSAYDSEGEAEEKSGGEELTKHFFFLPGFRSLSEAIIRFAKEKFKCDFVVTYPEGREEMKDVFGDVAYLFGVSIPLEIKYAGIDITPFVKKHGIKMLGLDERKDWKKIKGMDVFEFYAPVSRVVEEAGCVFIADTSKNSAAIIPQFRFIGAKNVVFFGFMWYKIKRYLEEMYYDRVFYADIMTPEMDRLKVYISDMKKIGEFLINAGQILQLAKHVDIKGEKGKMIILPNGTVIHEIFIFQVGDEIKKVFNFIPEVPD